MESMTRFCLRLHAESVAEVWAVSSGAVFAIAILRNLWRIVR